MNNDLLIQWIDFMSLKKHLLRFLKRAPGKRFQHYYHLINRRINHNIYIKTVFVLIGIISLLIGIVLLFMPGPGTLFLLLSALLFCLSSKSIAQWLDQFEEKVRAWMGR